MTDLIAHSSQFLDTSPPFISERGATIEAIIGGWLDAKESHSHSVKTQQAYRSTLFAFRELLKAHGRDLIWRGDDFLPTIADYAQVFAKQRSPKSRHRGAVTPGTQNQRLAILSSFYLYALKRRHILSGNPIDSVDRPSVEPYARSEAIGHLDLVYRLQSIDVREVQGLRDLALLSVLLSTGRRVSEVAALTRGSIQITGEQITLRYLTKGAKNERDTLAVDVSLLLARWLSVFYQGAFWSMPEDTPVWVNVHHVKRRGLPLGYHGIAGICKHYLETSKVHTTRHTFAILMEIAGAKLTDIQQRLGHKNAATTGIYMNKLTSDRNTYADRLSELMGLANRFTPTERDDA